MNVTGYTATANLWGGLFPVVGTHGVPLEIVLEYLKSKNLVMDWPDYIAGALRDGHKLRTIRARIIAAVGDVYGSSYRDEVSKRLELYFKRLA